MRDGEREGRSPDISPRAKRENVLPPALERVGKKMFLVGCLGHPRKSKFVLYRWCGVVIFRRPGVITTSCVGGRGVW